MLKRMTEQIEQTFALRTAIDGFMGRAQDLGLVHSVGALGTNSLLVTGTLGKHPNDSGPLPIPRLLAAAPVRNFKSSPFRIAILDSAKPDAPLWVAADVSHNTAISRAGPQDIGSVLMHPHVRILTESAQTATPRDVDSYIAQHLFQRMVNP